MLRIVVACSIVWLIGMLPPAAGARAGKRVPRSCTIYSRVYRLNKDMTRSSTRTRSQKVLHEIYDRGGRLIEAASFGERTCRTTVIRDGETEYVRTSCGRNYRNIDEVTYFRYDSRHRLAGNEVWTFRDNKPYECDSRSWNAYDDSGRILERCVEDGEGKLTSRFRYVRGFEIDVTAGSLVEFPGLAVARRGSDCDSVWLDTAGRPLEVIHYWTGGFLYRQEYCNDALWHSQTELRYHERRDSLWAITERRFRDDGKPLEHVWQVVNSGVGSRTVFEYNADDLPSRTLEYERSTLRSYLEYRYRWHRGRSARN